MAMILPLSETITDADAVASHQFHLEVPPDRVGRACERAQGHRHVVRIEQPVELGAAGLQTFGQHRPDEVIRA